MAFSVACTRQKAGWISAGRCRENQLSNYKIFQFSTEYSLSRNYRENLENVQRVAIFQCWLVMAIKGLKMK